LLKIKLWSFFEKFKVNERLGMPILLSLILIKGICYCTRCLRNDMTIKLKSAYCLLGGDIK
jgi:hypothetical protein